MRKNFILSAAVIMILFSCSDSQRKTDRLAKASKENKNGWIYIHLEGSPSDIGYQHGFLLASDIDTSIQAVSYLLQHDTHRDWQFYRNAAKNFLWDKLDREYKDEINGIVEGLQAQKKNYDSLDLTAYNALEELAFYYVPMLDNMTKPGNGNNKAPGNCSAFIATGSYTKDGKIVIGHNNWTEYIIGQHWNVIADIVPEKGHHLLMDCMPGFIHSGDDFVISDNGILITETTITQFNLFDSTTSPNARKKRMEQLVLVNMKGKLDAEVGKQIEADHIDALQNVSASNRCVICGHIDEDAKGCAEWSLAPYYPMGAVQGKVTTADLAKNMQLWAHMG